MSMQQAGERESLSSFMDGEAEAERVDAIVRACSTGPGLRDDWTVYHCIGDVLRSEDMGGHSTRLAAAISTRLAEEPNLMVPRPRRFPTSLPARRAASMFAAVAGVAVVAFVAWPRTNGPAQIVAGTVNELVVKGAEQKPLQTTTVAPVPVEFLAAHRQFSGGLATRGLQGQVRSVSLEAGR